MDEQTTTIQETGTPAAPEAENQGQQAAETGPEKTNALQKFFEGLFKSQKGTEMEEEKASAENTADGKRFTQADMDAAIEAARRKWDEETAEAERIKKLSPQERAMEEQQQKEAEIADLRSRLLKKELQENAIKALEKEGFPTGLAGVLDYSSKEKMEESLANTMKVFKDSLAAAIQSRLRGRTPEGLGGAGAAENMLKDQIARNVRGL